MKLFNRYLVSGLLLFVAWKVIATGISASILPPPEVAFTAFGHAVKTAEFWGHFSVSAGRVISAMAVAWMVAFPLGILLGYHRNIDELVAPFVFLTYPVPKIVLLPVFLVLFGLGDFSKIFMIALIIGYQILVTTRDSVLHLDKKYIDSFRSMGGTPAQTIQHVIVPAALPGAFTALRISTGTGIAVLFFVESFATSRGLGYFIMDAWGRFSFDLMFAGIIGMSLLGVVLYEFFNYLEKAVCAWKYIESGRIVKPDRPPRMISHIRIFGRMIKFSHTVFALPFALAAVVLAHREHPISFGLLFWILLAMVGARSAAMGFNRIADAHFDRENPRTSQRALAIGIISQKTALVFVAFFSGLFIFAAAMISPLCFFLSFPVLMILFSYSYTKRFTSFSHVYLGFSISLAPIGAWIAVTGGFDPSVIVLSLALLAYIAGFDILYACQDLDFDQKMGLFSIPARFGPGTAFHLSALLHLLAFVCFFLILIIFDLGFFYLVSLFLLGALLVIEHKLVKPNDLTHIQTAFFHVNSAISVLLFLGILGDELIRRWL
jgi:putative 4-hydroxybenzoate polyprenyltransferase